MAIKLEKKQAAEWTELLDRYQETFGNLETARDEFEEASRKVKEFRDERTDDWQMQFDEKSESWQEGDSGAAANSLIEEWNAVDFDDQTVTMPADLHSELEGLATEPE